ncbi:hypothetical protein AALO_G00090310 [Alosa alosa]|uniref:Uncharacterized protein n=1 Tax=Alosa alosa TaxID=278164 RepID=A0AAV6GXK8_9TELE|nr:hypothetical protein AALO_G00090310 [Alosa alosa]
MGDCEVPCVADVADVVVMAGQAGQEHQGQGEDSCHHQVERCAEFTVGKYVLQYSPGIHCLQSISILQKYRMGQTRKTVRRRATEHTLNITETSTVTKHTLNITETSTVTKHTLNITKRLARQPNIL